MRSFISDKIADLVNIAVNILFQSGIITQVTRPEDRREKSILEIEVYNINLGNPIFTQKLRGNNLGNELNKHTFFIVLSGW